MSNFNCSNLITSTSNHLHVRCPGCGQIHYTSKKLCMGYTVLFLAEMRQMIQRYQVIQQTTARYMMNTSQITRIILCSQMWHCIPQYTGTNSSEEPAASSINAGLNFLLCRWRQEVPPKLRCVRLAIHKLTDLLHVAQYSLVGKSKFMHSL
jgi:hypothetical protein